MRLSRLLKAGGPLQPAAVAAPGAAVAAPGVPPLSSLALTPPCGTASLKVVVVVSTPLARHCTRLRGWLRCQVQLRGPLLVRCRPLQQRCL